MKPAVRLLRLRDEATCPRESPWRWPRGIKRTDLTENICSGWPCRLDPLDVWTSSENPAVVMLARHYLKNPPPGFTKEDEEMSRAYLKLAVDE